MKRFGIRATLAPDHPRRQSHLLGDDWEGLYWYETAERRDEAYREFQREHTYSRRGDVPRLVLEKVDR
ncbi:MAG: hypothetical protein R3225_03770 [Halofilum sp. (in: g-proteobacteria)]|nr:hypothetical protein [Halofilum sp. (in: g-proteobacteria)]